MSRGITQDQVSQAADAIVATGERPTVEKIRNHLGTGSPNTVTRMLEGWRQGLSERLRQASLLPELPDKVGEAIRRCGRRHCSMPAPKRSKTSRPSGRR